MVNYGAKSDKDGMFYNIFPAPSLVEMCGYSSDEIWRIEFEETDDGEYWSFQDTGDTDFHLIYPHKTLFDICFAYGVQVEIDKGKGRIARLKVKNATKLD